MRFFAPLWLYFVLSSCDATTGQSQNHVYDTVITGDTLRYAYTKLQETSPYYIVNDDMIDTAKFHIQYPIFDSIPFNEILKNAILIDGEQSIEDAARSFIDAYDEFAEDHSTGLISAAWYKKAQARVINNTPLFLTLETAIDEYTGGAHGSHLTFYHNIDVQKSKKIALDELFHDDKFVDFVKIAEKQFRKQENISVDYSLEEDFFFEGGKFTLNDNFGLGKSSLIIYFNEYEIRPYAEGSTQIEIPYTDLISLLNIRGRQIVESIK